MKIIDKLISKIAILFLGFTAIIFIFLPFNIIETLSLVNITRAITAVRGNYLYSIGAIITLMLCIKSFFSGIAKGSNRRNHIVTPMNFGDLTISDEAIEGLTQNVISRIFGIRSSKITVIFIEGSILIEIKGQVAPEINIPSAADEIQNAVKDTVESHTGVQVSRVNVEISSISSPTNSLK